MKLLGSLDIKSINTVGLRVNEGLATQTLLSDLQLTKYAVKNQYYFTQEDHNVTLPNATTLPTGWTISVFSNKLSKGTVHILDNAGTEQYKVKPKKSVTIILLENTTAAGAWKVVESGSGGVGSRNVVITSNDEPLFTVDSGTVTVNPFVATVSNGFEEDGTPIEEILEFAKATALSLPESTPITKYIYLTLEGLIIEEDAKQTGGNLFPKKPRKGDIFYNKAARKNFKYSGTEWDPYPCVALGEVRWKQDNQVVTTIYPYNEWWWEDIYGDVRNTVILTTGEIIVPNKGTAPVGNFIVTIADGFDAFGHPIDYIVSMPYTRTVKYQTGRQWYIYVNQVGDILVEAKKQDGGDTLPTANFEENDIYFSKKDGRNYKAVKSGDTLSWIEYPCVAVCEIDAKDTSFVYPLNDWWWQYYDLDNVVAHSFFYQNNKAVTTQIVLDTEAPDKSLITINVGNTVLLSDTYDLGQDKKTISFINAIEAGMPIEVRWYIPVSTIGTEVKGGADTDLSNLTSVGNQKILPVGGEIGDIIVRSENGAKWAAPTGITIGTVFMSDLKYPEVPPGALEYNGTEIPGADELYPEFWKNWLVAGKMNTGSYTDYDAAMTANGGTCPFFALDVENKRFKTPTWADGVFAAAATTEGEINKYYKDQFQGHHHNYHYAPSTHKYVDGDLDEITNKPTAIRVDRVGDAISDGVNGEPRTGSETFPKHVRKRWFVQVANAIETTAYHNIDGALATKVNKAGDTMTGNLLMGTNQVRFGTADNYYYVRLGDNFDIGKNDINNLFQGLMLNTSDNLAPYYTVSGTAHRLLTTADDMAKADLSNIPANYDYVVESQVNSDGSWYRKYKSGWLEQGGGFGSNDGVDTIVTLLKPYTDTTYSIMVGQMIGTSGDPTYWNFAVINKTTSTVTIHNATNGAGNICQWEAKGMGAN